MTGDPVAGPAVPAQRSDARRPDAERFRGTTAGPALDRLADLARRLLGTTAAQVSLTAEVQSVAGAAGLPLAARQDSPVADSLCTVTVDRGAPLAVTDAPADVRVRGLPPVTSGAVAAYLGVPLRTERGEVVGALCAFDPEPRTWSAEDIAVLEQLAASAVAELELSALADEYQSTLDRWGLAIEAAGLGSFDWDLRTGQLLWDDRLLAMFGYDRSDFGRSIDDFNARVHPDDVDRVAAVLAAAVDARSDFAVEYRIVPPGGSTRWVSARGRVLADEHGEPTRVLGAAHDSTDVHDGQARVARVLEAMTAAFFSLDPSWRFSYVNAEAERLLGMPRDALLGQVVWDLFPDAVGSDFEDQYREAVATGRTVSFAAHYPPPLDAWYDVRAWPSPDGLSVYFLDVTEQRAAQERLERATRRARLVADVTTGLSETLQAEEAVARLAQLLVPALGDWCLVTLVDDDGGLRDVGSWHVDPALRDRVERYSATRLAALQPRAFLHEALRTQRPAVIDHDTTRVIAEVLTPGEARDVLLELAPSGAALLPMQAHGRTIGLLSVFRGPGRAAYDEDDLAALRDVAGRAALALDNARLFAQQQQLSLELQRSHLTPPPEPDHVEVVVRYEPAAAAAQIGGDWYDALLQPAGETVLVIGDVVGHDSAAAAAMGQVRGLLRGIAYTSGAGPAEVLSRLDAALEGLLVETTATAVVARVEQTPDERAAGVTRLRWSSAGHPPPLVLHPDGDVRTLEIGAADLLLGIDATSPRQEHEVALGRDSTVLLYTDGLVERRDQSLDVGIDRLRRLLAELGHLPLDALLDTLLERMLPTQPDDDVALVAVRLHVQDRPRPPVAGPRRVPPRVPTEPGP